MYTSILNINWLLYCSRHSLSTLEPRATCTCSSDWQAMSANTYRRHFLVWHFVHTSSTTRISWLLQHYHTPNNSPATKDAFFYIKSTVYHKSYSPHTMIWCFHRCLVRQQQTYDFTICRKGPLHYQQCIFSTSRNKLRLLICCPLHQSIRRVSPATSV